MKILYRNKSYLIHVTTLQVSIAMLTFTHSLRCAHACASQCAKQQVRAQAQLRGMASSASPDTLKQLMSKLSEITKSANRQTAQRPKKSAAAKSEGGAAKEKQQRYERRREAKRATIRRKKSRFSRKMDGGRRRDSGNVRRRKTPGDDHREAALNVEAQSRKADASIKSVYRSLSQLFPAVSAPAVDEKTVMDIFMAGSEKPKKAELEAAQTERRAQYIQRKVRAAAQPAGYSHANIRASLKATQMLQSIKRMQHLKPDYLSEITSPDTSNFKPQTPSVTELQLTKTKIPYDAKNRVLRALEQMAARRGYKLKDTFKIAPIPSRASAVYPFCDPMEPSNLAQGKSHLRLFDTIPESEVRATIDATVRGIRNELKPEAGASYKTEGLRLNSSVVINSLNSNAQMHVAGNHVKVAKVLTGHGQLKELPAVKK